MQTNNSGFHGYTFASLYPGMYSGVDQKQETAPEAEEQQAYANVDNPAPPAVDEGKKLNIFLVLGLLLILIFILR